MNSGRPDILASAEVELEPGLTEGSKLGVVRSNFKFLVMVAWDFTALEDFDFWLSWRLGFSGLNLYLIKSGSLSHTITCCSCLSVCLRVYETLMKKTLETSLAGLESSRLPFNIP